MIKELTDSGKISQGLLKELFEIRQVLAEKRRIKTQLKKDIEKLDYSEKALDEEIRILINTGHKISRGKFLASIGLKEVLPRLAWKQVFIEVVPNGEAKAEELMDDREPQEIKYIKLSMRDV